MAEDETSCVNIEDAESNLRESERTSDPHK